jgi:phage/plasmid-like protein (TIGR03299 family)
MSQETSQWLNTNTLIGFTDKRGHAWHYRAEDQGEQSNHYDGAIPVEDVRRRLFHWQAVEGTLTATHMHEDGVLTTVDRERKAIMRSDTGHVLGIFRQSYSVHQFEEWLLDQVGSILDDGLSIGSAGLLKGGAVAWVSVEVPDTLETPEGVLFRPNLLACTSHDGSLATTYQRVVTNVVCDNTMSAALREGGNGDDGGRQRLKVKHSRYSRVKLQEARDALAIIHTIADDFTQQVAELTAVKVSAKDWDNFLRTLVPMPEDEGKGQTRAQNKRDALNRMYEHDQRCAPWKGTAWGVVQTCNTFAHHESIVKGQTRADRNMMRAARGEVDGLDMDTLKLLDGIGIPVLA